MSAGRARGAWAIFAWPGLLAAATMIGLIAALIGDGLHDVLAWIALALPVVAVVVAQAVRRQ
ncbi:hypothetical protein [Sphingomonas baiyangensis]|uniref:Uncharacterized protein n=1 Tax=Sphingomonas baiyangensis TaxID=2572576 RepID=A0A4V5PU97_9SPHN|nr:hypothetical protein [Sphingomonas baiyangensis]TKD53088.1 hypothetical protein FBR43_01740 [Sphingomonas baiyangensis]